MASGLNSTRRRLSVLSDNKLVEGFKELSTDNEEGGAVANGEMIGGCVTNYGGRSKKGYAPYNPHKQNQDALVMATHSATKSLLLCVMDGHGENGDGVAIYMKRNFPDKLFNHPSFATDIEKAITDALDACENELLKKTKIDCEFSGTTFVCAVVRDGLVTCANVGDSRCIVGVKGPDGKLAGVAVSIDHKPELPLEKARILKAGGRVFAVQYDDGIPGPNRVWLGNIDVPGLAMSRSIGDTVAHTAGVTSIPEFFTQKLVEGQHAVMVLASDGLWEFMDDQAVMDKINEGTPGKDVAGIVDILVEEANSLWLKAEEVIDDTTVCVACLYGHTISAPSRK